MQWTTLVICVAMVLCYLLLNNFRKKLCRFVFLTTKIPGPSLRQVVTVHAKHLLGDNMVTYAWKLCEFYNFKPWGTWLTDLNFMIFVSDCETASAVCKLTDKPNFFYKQISQFLGRNLLTMNGPEYPQYRKLVGIALRKSLQDGFLPRVSKPMSELVKALREKALGEMDVDLRSLIFFHTIRLNIASFTSISHPKTDFGTLPIEECLSSAMDLIQMEAMNPVYYWLFLRMKSSTKRVKAAANALVAVFDDALLDMKSQVISTEDSDKCQDILEAFVQSYLKMAVAEKSDKELCEHGRIFLIASFETTSFAINCVLLLLALHQDVQQRVYDELDLVLGKKEGILVDDLDRMEYMEMVIKETLRLFPPAPVIAKIVREETNLNGILVPAGSVIALNVMALHRNPEYFPDPLKFDPNRFSPEASGNLRPYSFIPFSAGFRKCPGQLHAFLLMKLVLCHVVRNFRIVAGSKLKSLDDIKVKLAFTLHLQESSLRLVDRS